MYPHIFTCVTLLTRVNKLYPLLPGSVCVCVEIYLCSQAECIIEVLSDPSWIAQSVARLPQEGLLNILASQINS